jgi:hypothetical protein
MLLFLLSNFLKSSIFLTLKISSIIFSNNFQLDNPHVIQHIGNSKFGGHLISMNVPPIKRRVLLSILHLWVGIRSLPLLPLFDLHMFRFMIMLVSCFTLGKAHIWAAWKKCGGI